MHDNSNNFLHATPAQMKSKMYTGIIAVNLILAVSFAGSIMYWYALSVMDVGDSVTGVWKFILWVIVAVGIVTEIIKKVSLSAFRHKGIWLGATAVSVLTVMGTFAILDANRESTLVKQSDQYKMAEFRKESSLDTASQYGWAAGFNLASLENQLQQVVNERAKRRINYASYLSQKKALEKKIEAKRAYDSAIGMGTLSGEAMAQGGTGATSSNPLLSNLAAVTGVGADILKTVFYLMVTLLLEFAAFFFGGKVEEIKNRLSMTRAQLLDRQNIDVFGISVAEISHKTYQNVLTAENEKNDADREVNNIRVHKKAEPSGVRAEKIQTIRAESDVKPSKKKKSFMGFIDTDSHVSEPKNRTPSIAKMDPRNGTPTTAKMESLNTTSNGTPQRVPNRSPRKGVLSQSERGFTANNGTPKKRTSREHKTVRKGTTADTGIKGKNSRRYQALKKSIKEGKTNVTLTSIRQFKYGGKGMGTETARKYLEAIKRGD